MMELGVVLVKKKSKSQNYLQYVTILLVLKTTKMKYILVRNVKKCSNTVL